jgi:hypothetical protein
MGNKVTRRRFLTAVSAGAAYLALASTVGCELLERTRHPHRGGPRRVRGARRLLPGDNPGPCGQRLPGDHHEFLITQQDTALITIYNPVRWDLSPVGGPKDGVVTQGIVQELDIETGEVLFEWHSLDHVGLDETYAKVSKEPRPAIDYFHINSIDVDHDGNLLVSARTTCAVYKIDRKTGEVMWRLGGKKSDFEMGPLTPFAYQHDARRQRDGTITIFDNGTTVFDNGTPRAVERSLSSLPLPMERTPGRPACGGGTAPPKTRLESTPAGTAPRRSRPGRCSLARSQAN